MEKRKRITYTDQQKAEFCELAQYVGVGAAIRELGYPSYTAAAMWLEQFGIEAKEIDIMGKARAMHRYLQAEDLLKVVDEALNTVTNLYSTVETADDAMKLANAVNKLITSRNLLEGKASSIVEKRETSQADLEIMDLINQQKAENAIKEAQIESPKGN